MDTDAEVLDYLAAKILDDLRKGVPVSESVIQAAGSLPLVDQIRAQLDETDKDLLFSLMRSERSVNRRFAVAAIYRLQTQGDTKRILDLWREEEDFFVEANMIYAIFNKSGHASEDEKRELLEFLDQNRQQYTISLKKYYGENPPEVIRARLKDPVHEGKRCLYIHSLGVLGDRGSAEVVKAYLSDKDPLVREQAKKVLNRLHQSTVCTERA